MALGRQDAEEVNSQLPIVTDPAIADYIQTLGESIAKTTSRSDLDWHFYVVDTKQVKTLISQLPLDRSQKLIVDTPEFHAFKTRVSQLPLPPPPRDTPSNQEQ